METKTIVQKKKKRKKDNSWLHFYYKLVFWSLGRLGGGYCGGCWTFTLKVLLGRYKESCQNNLHVVGGLFFLGGVLSGSWRLGGIIGFLGYINFLFSNHKLLCLLGRDVDLRKNFGCALLAIIGLLGGTVSLGTRGA